jgi:Uma2 family endonuclease
MSTPALESTAPEEAVLSAYELERGKPMPSESHAITQMNLGGEFLKDKRFRPMSELAVRLPDGKSFVPDICIYPRVQKDFSHDVTERTDPPLTAFEIYSPHQGYNAVMEKVAAYRTWGVQTCWVVDPYQRTVTIFPSNGSPQTFIYGQVAEDPVTGLKADLTEVFS